jgi:putative transposase
MISDSGKGRGMSRGKHSEAEMIAALKQVEAGRKVEDVAREVGVSKHTIYGWKAKYGGLEVNEAQRLRQLEDENGRLKKLVETLGIVCLFNELRNLLLCFPRANQSKLWTD